MVKGLAARLSVRPKASVGEASARPSNAGDGGRPGGLRPVGAADGTVFDFDALKRKMLAEQKQ